MNLHDRLADTHRVTLQLSNRCSYSARHPKCPNHLFETPHFLPLATIKDIIADLREAGWGNGKYIAFHGFNEPGIDPRLYWLVGYLREQLPGICPILWTNGWYLDEAIGNELLAAGMHSIYVSLYSEKERDRLQPWIDATRGVDGEMKHLSPRVLTHRSVRNIPCFAPLVDLMVHASGNVGLCCMEYAEDVTFGNLNTERLPVLMEREYPRMKALYDDLVKRKRTLEFCQTCRFHRTDKVGMPRVRRKKRRKQ